MKATDRNLTELVNGNRQFIIPVFQRDYSWTTEQCNQIWNDILRAASSKGVHFIGPIVYVEGDVIGAAFQKWLLIDGQQRLTSVTLLLAALRDHILETGWKGSNNSPTTDGIEAYFLRNIFQHGDQRYKLVLRRTDNATLQALIDRKSPPDHRSTLIVEAYECFREYLRDPSCDPDTVFRGISNLKVVDVTLQRSIDDPQLIFESMNSTGVNLSQSDLVRNYLLMGLDEGEQTRLYDDYWCKIEDLFKSSSNAFDFFLRDYITMCKQTTQWTRADRIYEEFKLFWHPGHAKLEDRLRDMARFAHYYAWFRGLAPVQPEWLSDAMSHMRKLGTTQGVLIMRLYDLYEKGKFVRKDFNHAITLIESYILRRDVVGLPAKRYWSVFARVAYEIGADFESLKVALARLRDNNRFPDDDEFAHALEESDLYALRNCKHILDRLENAGQMELSPVKEYSIEHIMPQNIDGSSEWQRMLGNDWRNTHATWVHRLGNLTLTAYNSVYSNKPFEEKKLMKRGLKYSAVRLNQDVRDQDNWTATEMQERSRRLAKNAQEIWPHHKVDQARLQAAQIRDLRIRAAQQNSDSLEMGKDVRGLLRKILQAVHELGDIIELIEHKSVCCYGPDVFAELLPMKGYLRVILPLDRDEIEDPGELQVQDASGWKFVSNRVHVDFDLLVNIYNENEVASAVPMIRQAFDRQTV